MTLEFSRLNFEKYSNIRFHENLSSGSRVVPCGWTYRKTDGRTEEEKVRQTCRSVWSHLHVCEAPTQNAICSYTTPKNDRLLGRSTQSTYLYTGCNRRNGPDFGRVFLMLNYIEKPQNTYIQSWTVSEIMASEVWSFDSCYILTDYQIHIETGRNMWFL